MGSAADLDDVRRVRGQVIGPRRPEGGVGPAAGGVRDVRLVHEVGDVSTQQGSDEVRAV